MSWKIKKLGYSSNPWRLVDRAGTEVYADEVINHPETGPCVVSMPVCGKTKESVVDRVLAEFLKMRKTLNERTTTLQMIRTWAKCDDASGESREKAMADIVNKCDSVLPNKSSKAIK